LAQGPDDVVTRQARAAELLEGAGITPSGPLVLTVSRIAPQKSLEVLLAAAAALSRPVTWVVLGDGEAGLLSVLRRTALSLGVPVHFLGAVADPSPWLRAAEVFVLPSRWEARALVVQEAMAAGTPVVSSDVGGLHDLVDGVGLLVPVADASQLARSVEAVLGDSELRGRLSELGRGRAGSWDEGTATARRWHDWYASLPGMT
jgi:glycosyltransferase involved in cell wall biosynthesis